MRVGFGSIQETARRILLIGRTCCAPVHFVNLDLKLLKAFVEREPVVLSAEDVALVASRIGKEMQTL